ncbi:hypothetical protein Tco_0588845 [Tanacetum coccineum]
MPPTVTPPVVKPPTATPPVAKEYTRTAAPDNPIRNIKVSFCKEIVCEMQKSLRQNVCLRTAYGRNAMLGTTWTCCDRCKCVPPG